MLSPPSGSEINIILLAMRKYAFNASMGPNQGYCSIPLKSGALKTLRRRARSGKTAQCISTIKILKCSFKAGPIRNGALGSGSHPS